MEENELNCFQGWYMDEQISDKRKEIFVKY